LIAQRLISSRTFDHCRDGPAYDVPQLFMAVKFLWTASGRHGIVRGGCLIYFPVVTILLIFLAVSLLLSMPRKQIRLLS